MDMSYSSYSTYLACPKKYKYQIDRVEYPEKESKYFALYGILIQKFFETYVNLLIPKKITLDDRAIRNSLSVLWKKILDREYVNWDDPWVKYTPEQIFEEALADALENLSVLDIFPQCRSEVRIDIVLKNTQDLLTGRLDFIRALPDGTIEILDGKSSEHMDRADPEQLYFYALLYFLKHKKLPDKLGFIHYRYKLVQYVDFDQQILLNFKNKLALTKQAIRSDKVFKPSLKITKVCRWCPYKLICKELDEKQDANRAKRAKTHFDPAGGVIELN